MGTLCDAAVGAAKDTFYAFFPRVKNVPDCVLDLLKFIYPTVDWSNVVFHEGLPLVLAAGTQKAVVVPDWWTPCVVRVYFRPGEWDPCTCRGLGIIVHEGFHVLQIYDSGQCGVFMVRPFTILYLACLAGVGFDYNKHPMEPPAFAVEDAYNECCRIENRPCDCGTSPPTLIPSRLEKFKSVCSHVVQTSSGLEFFSGMGNCTPGLTALDQAAHWLVDKGCESERPSATRSERGDPLAARNWIVCLLALIPAALLWIIAGVLYVAWLVLWTQLTLGAWLLKLQLDLLGLVVSGALWIVAGVLCALEWLGGKVAQAARWVVERVQQALKAACNWASDMEQVCEEWEETEAKKCLEEKDEGYERCDSEVDNGYYECSETEDKGHNECCEWQPCSWFCNALVWISNIVCVASTWVKNLVCVASTWIKNVVCVSSTWIVSRTCKSLVWSVKNLTCRA